MTSRNLQSVISKFQLEKYEETISFLTEMVDLLGRIQNSEKGVFQPLQKDFMLSTMSATQLSTYLLEKRGFTFVLTYTFTQDCIENLFSVIIDRNT